jgi:hypothetical protein
VLAILSVRLVYLVPAMVYVRALVRLALWWIGLRMRAALIEASRMMRR